MYVESLVKYVVCEGGREAYVTSLLG